LLAQVAGGGARGRARLSARAAVHRAAGARHPARRPDGDAVVRGDAAAAVAGPDVPTTPARGRGLAFRDAAVRVRAAAVLARARGGGAVRGVDAVVRRRGGPFSPLAGRRWRAAPDEGR